MKTLSITAVVLAALIATAPAFAATQTVNMGADVDGTLTMTVKLFKNDIDGTDITAGNKIDFGQLVDIGTGTLRSSPTGTTGTGAGLAYITVNSHGVPYTITQTGSVMTKGGGVNLPKIGRAHV